MFSISLAFDKRYHSSKVSTALPLPLEKLHSDQIAYLQCMMEKGFLRSIPAWQHTREAPAETLDLPENQYKQCQGNNRQT